MRRDQHSAGVVLGSREVASALQGEGLGCCCHFFMRSTALFVQLTSLWSGLIRAETVQVSNKFTLIEGAMSDCR